MGTGWISATTRMGATGRQHIAPHHPYPGSVSNHNGGVMIHDLERDSLNDVLEAGGRWPFGRFRELRKERVGAEYGLSGRTYRLAGATASGRHCTVIVKVESADKIRRAAVFRALNEEGMAGSIPASYGWRIEDDGQGLITLEDVSPAVQGDELDGCSPSQAAALIDVVARLHSLSWHETANDGPADIEQWVSSAWERERWDDRLKRAHQRYPDSFTRDVVERLAGFNDETHAASLRMAGGPVTWTHHDPHLDNVLWRDDGSPVLLDWSGAGVGPPGLDLAVLFMSLSLGERSPLRPDEVIASYTTALDRHDVSLHPTWVREMAALGLRPLARGLVGWAGFPGEGPKGRQLDLRNDSVGRMIAGIEWLDSVSSG